MKELITIAMLSILMIPRMVAQSNHYTAKVASFSSTQYDEFSPVFYRNGIVFCSNREDDLFIKYTNNKNQENFNIYIIYNDTTNWKNSDIFDKSLVTHYNDGPVTFDQKNQIIYYSRNIYIQKKKKNILDFLIYTNMSAKNTLGIFSAIKQDGTWSNIKSFPYNSEEYNNTTPYYDTLNNRLLFASNMPGGYGSTDLYYCERTDSSWGKPVNMGSKINTSGTEVFPFMNTSGKLFFASDGHGGLGGKDIFFTEKKNGDWIQPIHLKPPLNSEDDDFGLITDHDFQSGYFSSNRNRTDDIYRFQTHIPQFYNCDSLQKNRYCYRFWDEGYHKIDTLPVIYEWEFSDGERISGLEVDHCFPGAGKYTVKLNIVDELTDTVNYTKQNFEVEIKDVVQPYIRSSDAFIKKKKMKFDGLKSNLPDFQIEKYYWDFGDGTLKHGPEVYHTYEKKGSYQVLLGVTGIDDSSGTKERHCVWKEVKIFEDYQALAMHQAENTKEKLSVKKSSPATHSIYNDEANGDLKRIPVKCYTIAEFPDKKVTQTEEAFSNLNNAHLEFNETEIGKNSHSILDHMINILKQNPKTNIEIAVHNDSTGLSEYNVEVSEEMAQSIINYLISNGISKNRLHAVGYGESRPMVVSQTESVKHKNKRVEFILIYPF